MQIGVEGSVSMAQSSVGSERRQNVVSKLLGLGFLSGLFLPGYILE